MPAPATTDDFVQITRQSGLLDEKDLDAYLRDHAESLPNTPSGLAAAMVRDGLLTRFQAGQFLQGKWRGFLIAGKYKLLEHLGTGGMASVFLCEHVSMHRRVALKVLPKSQANDPGVVERFYREARAVGTLDHPNIVRAHDIDHDGKVHFLVMEYVEGSSLQDIVRLRGPLPIERAAHYIRQAAVGLDAAHHAGLVHRDIKPGNILVDRSGTVKILDMGLARFFHDEGDEITKKFDENCVLGTADYCAPEQALNSHAVDIRVDIYSLGATFYYLLTGRTPFGEGTTAQKIIWHQMKEPTPIRELRPEVPPGLADVIARMMAKQVEDRYQTPAEVYDALAPWAPADIPPPSEDEMPKLCPRSKGPGSGDSSGSIRRSGITSAIGPRSHGGRGSSGSLDPTVITPRPSARSARSGKSSRVARAESEPSESRELPKWLIPALIGVAALLVVTVGGLGLWWALSGHGKPPVAVAPPPPEASHVPQPAAQQGAAPGNGAVTPAAARDVTITAEGNVRHVRAPRYEAVIEGDGNLTSLKVGGVEFFKSGLKFGNQEARGAYVYAEGGAGGVQSLPQVEQSGNAVTAKGDRAAVRSVFNPSSINWTVSNLSDGEERFYIVFDKAVRAVTDGQGNWAEVPPRAPPVARDWPTTSWFADRARLTLLGGTRIWGQFPDPKENYQVWEMRLEPHQTREVAATVGEATPEELARVAAVTGTAAPATSPALSAEGVTIQTENTGRRVLAPKYEAVVANDGCVTSLKVGGVELLRPGLSISRGGYFHQQTPGTLALALTDPPAANAVAAKSDKAAARYDFGADGMTWTLTNATGERMNYFLVFSKAVKAVTNGTETVPTPTVKEWPTTTWLFGKGGRLKITGGTRIWGPWPTPNDNQVWHADLNPHETRRVSLQVVEAPEGPAGVSLQSPRDYQVFQRRTRREGAVVVRGTAPAGCDAVEARLTGTSLDGPLPDDWRTVYLAADRRGFNGTLPTKAGGWYKLEVRALRDKKVVSEGAVEHVGVGEVFVTAGQSNATNCGEERQKAASGMVAAFGGDDWQLADDPQPGVQDGSNGGSPWPPFGDALYAKYKVPIGIASTGRGGTSAAEWKPDGELFRGFARRLEALGPHGCRAVLWHQGEADFGTRPDDYARQMTDLIHASQKAAGWDVPWFVAQVSYQSPGAQRSESTRAGQKKLWDSKVALEGPDTDALGGDNRDNGGKGIHFSGKGLRAHGKLWADKVSAYLDKVLSD